MCDPPVRPPGFLLRSAGENLTKGWRVKRDRPAILAEGLKKSYGKSLALDGLDLRVEEGTILGLLGPNGAGKTTAVRILTTLLAPDAGRAEVAGLDVVRQADELRSRIGLTGQYAAVDEYLTGRENLEMVGRLYHLPKREARRRADELLERFDLVDAASRLVKTYSGGMRRRLDLSASLVFSPPVLFVDDAGRVIAEGTSGELKAQVGGERLEVTLEQEDGLEDAARVLERYAHADGGVRVDTERRYLVATVAGGAGLLAAVVRDLDAARVRVDELGLHRPTLDDVFLTLTGHAAEPYAPGHEELRDEKEIA